jgi:hypothetical protein
MRTLFQKSWFQFVLVSILFVFASGYSAVLAFGYDIPAFGCIAAFLGLLGLLTGLVGACLGSAALLARASRKPQQPEPYHEDIAIFLPIASGDISFPRREGQRPEPKLAQGNALGSSSPQTSSPERASQLIAITVLGATIVVMPQSLARVVLHVVFSTKHRVPFLRDWQGGYGSFSISQSKVEAVRAYIARQEEHHRTVSFQDEFRALCRKHGLEIDERYVWD